LWLGNSHDSMPLSVVDSKGLTHVLLLVWRHWWLQYLCVSLFLHVLCVSCLVWWSCFNVKVWEVAYSAQ
jgi:hypothetical protein